MKLSAAVAATILAFASAQGDRCNDCPATATVTVTQTETSTQTVTETVFPSSSLVAPVSSGVGVPHKPGRPHHYPHYTTIVTKIPTTTKEPCTITKTYVSSSQTYTTTYESTTTLTSTITSTITIPLSSSVGAFQTGTGGWYPTGGWSSIVAPVSTSAIGYPGYGSSSYGVSSSVDGAISSSFYPSASVSVIWDSASVSYSSLAGAISSSIGVVSFSSGISAPPYPYPSYSSSVGAIGTGTGVWGSSASWSFPTGFSGFPSSSLAGAISSGVPSASISLPPYPYPSYSSSVGAIGTGTGVWGSSSSWSFPASFSGFPSSSLAGAISSAPVPSSSALPGCWSACFAKAGNPSESELCSNTKVTDCICNTCSPTEDKAYKSWLESYCAVPSSASSIAGAISSSFFPSSSSEWSYPSSSSVDGAISSSFYPSSSGWPYPSSSSLAGAISSSLYPSSSSWIYPSSSSLAGAISSSFYPSSSSWIYPSSSSLAAPISSSVGIPIYGSSSSLGVGSSIVAAVSSSAVPIPSSSSLPSCWTECFGEAGITSESDLCGNTVVDKCIHDTCSPTEDEAYWSWYNNYCGVSSSAIPSATSVAGAVSSSLYPSSSSWSYPAPSSSFLAGAISSSVFPSSSFYSLPPYPTPSSSVGAIGTGTGWWPYPTGGFPYPTGGYSSSFSFSYGPSASLAGAISSSGIAEPSSSSWAYSSSSPPVYGGHKRSHARDIGSN